MARHGENIRKRKDGRWEARFICGYRENGKAKYKYIYKKTYAEAKEAKNQMISQKILFGTEAAKRAQTDITFDVLITEWLSIIQKDVKESTYSRYTAIIDKHIKPSLGNVRLSDMRSEDIDHFTQEKLNYGNLKKPGGLSAKTVTSFLSIIRLVLNYGTERGYCCPNPIVIRNPRQTLPQIQILTWEEQQKLELILLAEKNTVSWGIMNSLYLGLRIGEVCALRWEDMDMENALLYVQRSIQRIPDASFTPDAKEIKSKTKIIIDSPKTNSSSRKIPIPSFRCPIFDRYKADKTCYVLTGALTFLEPRGYYRKYKKVMEKCGLGHFNYHALRHTFATRCVENDFDIKSLSEILGHANVSTTLQRYVHPSETLKRQHMDKLSAIAVCGQNSGHSK